MCHTTKGPYPQADFRRMAFESVLYLADSNAKLANYSTDFVILGRQTVLNMFDI